MVLTQSDTIIYHNSDVAIRIKVNLEKKSMLKVRIVFIYVYISYDIYKNANKSIISKIL